MLEPVGADFIFSGGVMSSLWHRAERYRYLANESRRLAANDPYTESQSFHLHMAVLYSTLAEAAELKTTIGRQPCTRPHGRRRAKHPVYGKSGHLIRV
jgi:hypothetical protein